MRRISSFAAPAAAALGLGALALIAVLPPAGAGAAQASNASVEARERLRRGIELARQGMHEGAVAELQRYVAEVPSDAEGHFHLGRSLLEIAVKTRGPMGEAVEELEQALRLDPDRDYVRLQLAETFARRIPGTFRPDRMIQLYEELLARHPDRFEARLRFVQNIFRSEARLARRPARPEEAGRVYQDSAWAMDLARFHLEKVLDQAPRDSDEAVQSLSLLAEVQFRMGEWDAARATLERLIQAYGATRIDVATALDTIGHCHWRKGEFAKAAELFRRAVDLAPANDVFLYDLMVAHDSMGGPPKGLPERYRFPLRPESYDPADPPLLKFTDIAPQLHVDKYAGAGPCGWADYDGDGRLDLVACGCDTYCTLYRATKSGFEDATIAAKLTRLEPGFGSAWGDYDNDGDPDLFISRNGWNGPAPDSLLRNEGDGTFTDVAEAAGVADPGSGFHSAWLDFDRDGWLDLIVSNGVYVDGSFTQLYRNRGNGTFDNVTRAAGLGQPQPYGLIGVALGDFDDDGWTDIFYHGRFEPNRLYRNRGDGTFEDVAARAGVAGPGTENGYIAFMMDFDSDGDLDIWTGSLEEWGKVVTGYRAGYRPGPLDHIPRFYRNNGGGSFTDSSLTVGFREPLGIMAAGAGDLDNDGFIDLYLGTGNPEVRRLEPNILYHNRGGKTFEDMTRFAGLGNLGKGHGIIYQDWDGDGDLDIFAQLGGFYHGDWWHSAFYRNEQGSRNNWIGVRLSQPERNLRAIGARVMLHAGLLHQAQEVSAGRGFGSTDPPGLHFGLGRATRVDRIEIRWPDGSRQTLQSPRINVIHEIRKAPPR